MKKLLVLLLFAFVANALPVATADILMHKYSMIECKVNATMQLLDNTANLSDENEAQKSALMAALEEMKSYAQQGNVSAFNKANVELQRKLQNATGTLRRIKQQIGKPENGEKGNGPSKSQMLKNYDNARRMEAQCLSIVAPALARVELKEWKEWQEQKRERLRILARKNIKIGRLTELVDAQNASIKKYAGIIDNSTIEELREMRTALIQEQLKLRARYEIEYMRVLLDAMNKTATEKGYDEDAARIGSLLDNASQKTAEYSQEEFKQAWAELKEAAELMRILFKKIKSTG